MMSGAQGSGRAPLYMRADTMLGDSTSTCSHGHNPLEVAYSHERCLMCSQCRYPLEVAFFQEDDAVCPKCAEATWPDRNMTTKTS